MRFYDGTADDPLVVYAYLDEEGDYLYIGHTGDLKARHREHRRLAPWFAEAVERVILFQTPLRSAAREAEARAIQAYRPFYNVCHNTGTIVSQVATIARVPAELEATA